jgi:hypothetical protein
MQIKRSAAKNQINNVGVLKDGRRIVMEIDTKDLLKNKGANYYALYKGANAYFFDDPVGTIHNNVLVKCDKNYYVLTIPELILDLIFWRANVIFNLPITSNEMYSYAKEILNKNTFNNIIEHVTKILVESQKNVTSEISDCLAEIKNKLSLFSQNFSSVKCNTISIWSMLNFRNRNKEFNELFNTTLDISKTIKETEIIVKNCEKRLTEVIAKDDYNCFKPYVMSGRLKTAQLAKVVCTVGTRPDIDKTIIPRPITKGYIHGLQNAAEFYMETITARDAMMTKNDNLPRSGFLSRKINRLTSDISINYKVKDCGNDRYLNYYVENADYLDMVDGKYMFDEKTNHLRVIDYERDKNLIGKTIKIRTLITCNCKDGVCQACAGTVSTRLRGTRLGTLPAIKCINPMSQKALSAKHDLGTKSIEIKSDTLSKYFYSDGMDFFIRPEYASQRELFLVVQSDSIEDLINSNVDTSDDEVDTVIALDYIAVRDHGVDYPIENEGMRIALSDELLANKRAFVEDEENSDNILIPLNKIESTEDSLFYAILDTEEISKYLNQLIGTIDRNTVSKYTTYDELVAAMVKIIYESGFVDNIIHFESIANSMIRDKYDKTIKPDWSKKDVEYQILKISDAIMNKDFYTALSYQNLRNLFKTASITKRMGVSLYDPFFRVSKDW